MMKPLIAAVAVFCTLLSTPLAAENTPVVVELFTSQGCSSCPPADELMHRLSERDDVVALALHVDYWDYIGWKDQFARPEHTDRQKAYAAIGGRRMIYTPQMIVNGQDDLVGAKSMELADLITKHKAAPRTVALTVARQGATLGIRVAPVAGALNRPMDVHLVRYVPRRNAHITRGENAGRDLVYANVVDDWTVIGQWSGTGEAEFSTDLTGDLPTVILVQLAGQGAIVAAARVD